MAPTRSGSRSVKKWPMLSNKAPHLALIMDICYFCGRKLAWDRGRVVHIDIAEATLRAFYGVVSEELAVPSHPVRQMRVAVEAPW